MYTPQQAHVYTRNKPMYTPATSPQTCSQVDPRPVSPQAHHKKPRVPPLTPRVAPHPGCPHTQGHLLSNRDGGQAEGLGHDGSRLVHGVGGEDAFAEIDEQQVPQVQGGGHAIQGEKPGDLQEAAR